MRILIFGGTGPTGIALTRRVLEEYPTSTIFLYVRSPQKVPEDLARHASVVIIHGEITDLDGVETALAGHTTTSTETKNPSLSMPFSQHWVQQDPSIHPTILSQDSTNLS
jgi:uncharacterized protein YbjT (DUF2867 family)